MKHLLLLHGAIGSGEQLKPLEEKLRVFYTVHVLTFPGHGGTAMPDAFSIPLFAEFVKTYCENNQLDKVFIFGYSMGGYIALYLAKHQPSFIEKLVTLATKFEWNEKIAEQEIKKLQPETIERKVPQFAAILNQRHRPNDWKIVLNKTAGLLKSLGDKNCLQAADYTAITTPCLLLVGDRDPMVSFDETLAVYKSLPMAELCVLPGTDHPIEKADILLLQFITRKFLG